MDKYERKYLICPHCGTKIYDVDFELQQQDLHCSGCGLNFFLFRENQWLAMQFKAPMLIERAALKPA